MQIQAQISDFILPAFNDPNKYSKVMATRRGGKTYNSCIWLGIQLFANPNTMGLWVDTTQPNLARYRDLYFSKIFGDAWKACHVDAQGHDVTFPNGSVLHMRSSQRPELMEGFEYDYAIVNEAFIVLKKERIWENTIQPMLKNAWVKIVGSVKIETVDLWDELPGKEYVYTPYDSEHYTNEEIEEIKSNTDSFSWRVNYMCEKLSESPDALVNRVDLRYYEDLPHITDAYMHIDCTHTGKESSDFVACGIIGEGKDKNFYIIDYYIKKLDQEHQARELIKMYEAYSSQYNIRKVTFDEKSNQGFGWWAKELARKEYNVSLPLSPLKYPKDKFSHFAPHVPHFKANRVYFPKEHPNKREMEKQLLVFPHKDFHDDAVDLLSGLLDNYKKNQVKPGYRRFIV